MAHFATSDQFQISIPPSSDHGRFGLKTESFDYDDMRHTYTYSTQHPYSEEELAESLGWIDYPQSARTSMLTRHGIQLSAEMNTQEASMQHSCGSIPHSGSIASNGTLGSTRLRQSGHSPSGWQSSLDSQTLLSERASQQETESSLKLEADHVRLEGSVVAAEKKAMRRYSHNAVERRRRDNINEQIHELAVLVTELDHLYSPRSENVTTNSSANCKPNKGVVLRKSVEYIRMLRNMAESKADRERLLEEEREIMRLGGIVPNHTTPEPTVSMWIDESAIAEDEDL